MERGMLRRTFSVVMIVLLCVSIIMLAFNIQPTGADAQTICINADGSITPAGAPIGTSDNITYAFTGNISYPAYNGLAVLRNNTVIDGNGYTVQGNQSGSGISLTDISNVTIMNTNIEGFSWSGIWLDSSSNNRVTDINAENNNNCGIWLFSSSNNIVSGSNATANFCGILLEGFSSNNTVTGNNASANVVGISLVSHPNNNTVTGNNASANDQDGISLFQWSNNNTVTGNNASANGAGIFLSFSSSNNTITANDASANVVGIGLFDSSDNNTVNGNNAATNKDEGIHLEGSNNSSVSGNNATANVVGIQLDSSSSNSIIGDNITASNDTGIDLVSSFSNNIYHNNFINNTHQVTSDGSPNTWDDGYPSGGNYWSDYNGTDMYSGPFQNQTGSDGIGDTPYIIDVNNTDHYPLMKPYPWGPHDIGITNVASSGTMVTGGSSLTINVTVFNYGEYTEFFNLTVYANAITVSNVENVSLGSRQSTTITVTWDTKGFLPLEYTISAYVTPIPGETDMTDNTRVDSTVQITSCGGRLPYLD